MVVTRWAMSFVFAGLYTAVGPDMRLRREDRSMDRARGLIQKTQNGGVNDRRSRYVHLMVSYGQVDIQ